MLKPTRTILALAAGSLVLGLVGAGAAVADEQPSASKASQQGTAEARRYAIGKVVSKGPLKVRSKPNTDARIVGQVYPHRTVEIECKKYGESVDGNALWYRLHHEDDDHGSDENGSEENGGWPGSDRAAYGHNHWVAARYVQNLTSVRYCH
ncbi:SH3 domain-containing protein [Streptomyces sp. NPDC048349]|uniref:SH3 domain-containing protein n=1 Tax=Streptomyces sp. NPDC048349 TaxID=3155486 RepID=UPI00344921A6